VLLGRRAGAPALLALPRLFHVGEATARAFPALAPALGALYGGEKCFLDAERAFGRPALAALGPPRALLFPSIGSAPSTRLEPLSTADALGRLVEASAFVVVDGAPGVREQLALLGDLASGARPWAAVLGRDVLDAPGGWAERIGRELGLAPEPPPVRRYSRPAMGKSRG
jgi:hypothetical protein